MRQVFEEKIIGASPRFFQKRAGKSARFFPDFSGKFSDFSGKFSDFWVKKSGFSAPIRNVSDSALKTKGGQNPGKILKKIWQKSGVFLAKIWGFRGKNLSKIRKFPAGPFLSGQNPEFPGGGPLLCERGCFGWRTAHQKIPDFFRIFPENARGFQLDQCKIKSPPFVDPKIFRKNAYRGVAKYRPKCRYIVLSSSSFDCRPTCLLPSEPM